MFANDLYQATTAIVDLQRSQKNDELWMVRWALRLYQRSHNQSRLGRLWSILTKRRRCLLSLGIVERTCVRHRFYAGIRTVPIKRICGSEGRCADFDAAFRPRHTQNRWRWVSIAIARQMGVVLPPVDLIQIGDIFFVRDGHQRISVARALGQSDIDAQLTVWNVAGPLPWEQPPAASAVGRKSLASLS